MQLKICVLIKRKKGQCTIIQSNFQFYVIGLEKPTAVECARAAYSKINILIRECSAQQPFTGQNIKHIKFFNTILVSKEISLCLHSGLAHDEPK